MKQVQLRVGYSTNFNPNRFSCSLRSFTFSDNRDSTLGSRTFAPQYPGSCSVQSDTETLFTMDNRDFVGFINSGFTANQVAANVYMYTTGGTPFAPPIALEPIPNVNALRVRNYDYFPSGDVNPILNWLDVYLTSTELLLFLHFDAIISTGTLSLNQIVLTDGLSSENRRTLSAPSLNNNGPHVKTACVRVSDEDRFALMRQGICTSNDNCFLYVPVTGYVRSHTTFAISNPILQQNARQTRYFWTLPSCKWF